VAGFNEAGLPLTNSILVVRMEKAQLDKGTGSTLEISSL
jgi:hypothetical protein